jgi:radical SAM protein with 4Fe4S-binding SPASM domain
VVGCEYDHGLEYVLGKIGEKRFADIWNGPRAVELRKNVRNGTSKAGFCSRCPYEGRKLDRSALFTRELKPAR